MAEVRIHGSVSPEGSQPSEKSRIRRLDNAFPSVRGSEFVGGARVLDGEARNHDEETQKRREEGKFGSESLSSIYP